MAEKIGDAFVDIGVRDKKFNAGLAKSQKRFSKFGAGIAAKAGAIGAALAVGLAGRQAIAAFAEQEQAEADLTAALAASGNQAQITLTDFKAFAAGIQQVTTFGDEAVIANAAFLTNLGVTSDKLKEASTATIGLAAAFKIDLKTAANLVGRASKGQTSLLTRYGIVVDTTKTKQEQFNELLELGADKFKLAEAAADTTRGRMQQLKNAFGDVGEAIIGALSPSGSFKESLKGLTNIVTKVGPVIARVVRIVATFARALAGPMLESLRILGRNLGAILPQTGKWEDALIGVLQTVNKVINRMTLLGALAIDVFTGQFTKISRDIKKFDALLKKSNKDIADAVNNVQKDAIAGKNEEVDNFIDGEEKKQAAVAASLGTIGLTEAVVKAQEAATKFSRAGAGDKNASTLVDQGAKQVKILESIDSKMDSAGVFA